MSNDPNRADASSAVTVEHVLAALDHIQQTVQAIRNALSGLAPELTLMENGPDGLPKVVVGRCPPPEEGRVAAASSAPDSPKPKEVARVCPPPEEEHVTRAATDRPKLTVGICPPPDEEKGATPAPDRRGDMASPAGVRTLEVILTASCNLRCGYCYQNAKQARHMEWATLREALDLLLHSDQRDCAVLFIGGEPLLQLPLIERAVAHVGAHRPPWKSVRFVTSTNGTLLDEASLAFLARHDFDTQISFDGVPAAQEFRGPGTHRKIDRALDTMRRQHPAFFRRRLNVAMTLHSGNLPYLADSVDYLIDKQVPTIGIAPLTTPDPGWTLASMDTLRRQLARVFERSLAHYRATGQVPLELFRKRDGAPTRRPAGRSMCGVARGEAIAVDVDGQVTGCVTFAESYQRPDNDFLRRSLTSMRMGNIAEPGLAERMARYPEATAATGIFDRKQDKYSSLARCGECRFLAECAICPTGIGHIPGNADPRRVPDAACAFNLVSLELRERFPAQPSLADLLIGRAPVPTLLRELLERAGGGAGEARA